MNKSALTLQIVKQAHDVLSNKVESPGASRDALRYAGSDLCVALLDYYAALGTGEPEKTRVDGLAEQVLLALPRKEDAAADDTSSGAGI